MRGMLVDDISRFERLALDELDHLHTRPRMNQRRRQPCSRRRFRGHRFPVAENMMKGKIPPKADDIGLLAIDDLKTLIAEPAA